MLPVTDGWMRRDVIRGGVGVVLGALAGCTSGSNPGSNGGEAAPSTTTEPSGDAGSTVTAPANGDAAGWRSTELTDINSGASFSVQQFSGRPVLLEFFAVWCPVCTRQQQQIGGLVDRMADLVAISINVDPNEDAANVREHVAEYGFDWRYAVAPSSMTKALIDEFGTVISNAPAAPVVRVCSDETATLVEGRGLKSIDDLEAALDQC